MNLDITLKREFIVNGKVYNSIEEMPNDVREAFQRAMNQQSTTGREIGRVSMMGTNITFNGTEYESLDAMPKDVRQLYNRLMKTLETGSVTPEIAVEMAGGNALIGPPSDRMATPRPAMKLGTVQATFSFSFSLRKLIVTLMLVALFFFLYYLFHSIGVN